MPESQKTLMFTFVELNNPIIPFPLYEYYNYLIIFKFE